MKSIDFFPRFNELDDHSLRVAFHIHSTWTDGKNTVPEIIEHAQKKQLAFNRDYGSYSERVYVF